MPGPAPKNPKTRQRRNHTTTAQTLVETSPLEDGIPELPKRRDDKGRFISWRPEVLAWWEDVWTSPMATEFVRADLHGLYMLADLLDQYWRKPTAALASEIRLQRQAFGLSPIDRRRLQWEIKRAERDDEPQQQGRKQRDSTSSDPRKNLKVV